MKKYSIVGVANAMIIDADDNLLGSGILDTLSASSIEISTGNTELRAGDRNKLVDIFYHTPAMSSTISDVKLNLDIVAANVGASGVGEGTNIFHTEKVTLVGGSGATAITPVALDDGTGTAYGWVCYDGVTQKVEFTGNTFTPTNVPATAEVAVTYYQYNEDVSYVNIPASIIPQRVRVVLTCALSTNDTSKGVCGYAQFDIGVFQLAGSQTFNMTPDGFVTTDITGMVLEDTGTGSACTGIANDFGGGKYAKLSMIINDRNWYDDVVALAIEDGDFSAIIGDTKVLKVYGIRNNGSSFLANNSLLTFTSDTTATATVGANTGLVTALAVGTTLVGVEITAKTTIEGSATVTVTAS